MELSLQYDEREYNAPLGDARLVARSKKIGKKLFEKPDASFPKLMKNRAELEATYRFINNSRVSEQTLFSAHQQMTIQRTQSLAVFLAIHDTTKFEFPLYTPDQPREYLATVSSRQGFFCHTTLLTRADGIREPLGILRFQPFIHANDVRDQEMRAFWLERGGIYESEKQRWTEAVEETQQLVPYYKVIHITDRESDFYEFLVVVQQRNSRYVVRHSYERKLSDGSYSKENWEQQELVATRTVQLSARTNWEKPPATLKKHPVRSKREAILCIKARKLELKRPSKRPDYISLPDWKALPEVLEVNAVQVVEKEPPEGQPPVEWFLFTSEPISTREEVLQVVDYYVARWQIEELFKALKTGCAYQERQEESAEALFNVLALTWPVAWALLRMRVLAELEPEAPAENILKSWELRLLRELTPKYKWKAKTATVKDVMLAMAYLGGHFRSNIPPGWLVLGRGYQSFLEHKTGAEAMLRILGVEK